MQTAMIGNEVLPMQQPIFLEGGSLQPLNVYHKPVWMNSKDGIESNNSNNNLNSNNNSNNNNNNSNNAQNAQLAAIQRLNQINSELDQELNKIKPILSQNIILSSSNNGDNNSFSRINGFDSRFKEQHINFIENDKNDNNPLCIRREGMLKIRDVDQKDKDVVVTYAVLTKERLSYFVNSKDETSIQGSIELGKIKESLKLINGFPTCFTIKTIDGVSDCSVCAESEDSSREWINAITQNSVNCNTMSALNNLNKRGLLK